ncbi:MAG: hypothetical protein ABW169_14960 [Sphingobium sp.]
MKLVGSASRQCPIANRWRWLPACERDGSIVVAQRLDALHDISIHGRPSIRRILSVADPEDSERISTLALTSLFCRTQEALQRDRAASAVLENVRLIATQAAVAWGHEAALAQKREDKVDERASLPAAGSRSEALEDSFFSENPDRGRTDSLSSLI